MANLTLHGETEVDGDGSVPNILKGAPAARLETPIGKGKERQEEPPIASERGRKPRLIPYMRIPPVPDWDPSTIISLSDIGRDTEEEKGKSRDKSVSRPRTKSKVRRTTRKGRIQNGDRDRLPSGSKSE